MSTAEATAIEMPRLTDSMEEGTILHWLKAVGDEVAVGEPLVEVETDKANMACESFVAGTLLEAVAAEGETLSVGSVIAWVGAPGATPPADGEPPTDGQQPAEGEQPTADAPAPNGGPRDEAGSQRVKASPIARKMASEAGLDLGRVVGSGPGGRVTKADVEAAVAESGRGAGAASAPEVSGASPSSPSSGKGTVETIEPTTLQRTVARRMTESKTTIPHFQLTAEIDMSRCVEARGRIKASARDGEPTPSLNDMVVKAVALALREVPRANGAYRDGLFELYERVNVGVAVAANDALVVPTIFDADRKGLAEIARETRRLAERVRDGSIAPAELDSGTFTISNLGMLGVDDFAAVVNPPQAGILAVGRIVERPVVRSGELGVGSLMRVTLGCDHRILYGADGARLLAHIRTLLEEPVSLAY